MAGVSVARAAVFSSVENLIYVYGYHPRGRQSFVLPVTILDVTKVVHFHGSPRDIDGLLKCGGRHCTAQTLKLSANTLPLVPRWRRPMP